jgi:O-antigen biosynthesis protein
MSVLVLIPVFGGAASTEACLRALLEARLEVPHRVLIVNDASPDPHIAPMLEAIALTDLTQQRNTSLAAIELRHNAANRGFTANVNQALGALRANEHMVLLNSDTLVSDDWLDEMMRSALSDSQIGTVTPFSNNATICSFPDFHNAWPVPPRGERQRIATALIAERAPPIDLPTGVGFCMLMTRACIDAVGRFDIENFPRGYGEENDFCMRAAAAGFRNVLCPNAFVAHEGGVSFSAETTALMKAGAERLLAKHPQYDALVSDWIARDPAKLRREAIVSQLAAR